MPLTKIQSLGITDGTIVNADINASAAIAASKLSGVANTPAFLAHRSANQSISDATLTKVQFNTEVFDVGGCYDNATNYRFTPNVAGKYMIFCAVELSLNDYGIYNGSAEIKFNGSTYATTQSVFGAGAFAANMMFKATIEHIISFNGTTDYVEVFGYIERHTSTGNRFGVGTKATYFGGYKIIE